MIAFPHARVLTSAMLVGVAVGLVAGIAATTWVHTPVRPDVVIGLVVGVPTVLGLLAIFLPGRRGLTTLGAFVLAWAPGWFGALAAVEVVTGG